MFPLPWIKLHPIPIPLLLQSHVASFIADYIVNNPPVRFPLQLPLLSQFLPVPHLYYPSFLITLSTTRLFFLLPRLPNSPTTLSTNPPILFLQLRLSAEPLLHLFSFFSDFIVNEPAY